MIFNLPAPAVFICGFTSGYGLAAAFQVPGDRFVAVGFAARNHVWVLRVDCACALYDDCVIARLRLVARVVDGFLFTAFGGSFVDVMRVAFAGNFSD